MPLIKLNNITRDFIRANRDAYFIFGDNMCSYGDRGQAAAMRGEPNTIGIPTRWKPGSRSDTYFSDEDWTLINVRRAILDRGFYKIRCLLEEDKTVYFPSAGIGTGFSQLPVKAPKIFTIISEEISKLEKEYK